MKKLLILCLALLLLSGCALVSDPLETTPAVSSSEPSATEHTAICYPDFTAAASGGYLLQAGNIQYISVVDGSCQYVCFESSSMERRIELYISPTETIVTDHNQGETACYSETYIQTEEVYKNPVTALFDSLAELDFAYVSTDGDCCVFEATQIEEVIDQEQIDYTRYTLAVDWTDQASYLFNYYIYDDGATLISAEAPSEINPLLTENTPWVIDMGEFQIYNTVTGEAVPLEIVGRDSGQALSPNGGNETVVEYRTNIQIYADAQNGSITKIQYSNDSTSYEITILSAEEIAKPTITENMQELEDDELQTVLLLLSMVGSLV